MKILSLIALLLSFPALASNKMVSADVAIQAYQSGQTSGRTLIVKPLDLARFFVAYGALGTFAEIPGLQNVGYFRLHFAPTADQAQGLLARMGRDANLEYAYFNPIARDAVASEPAADDVAVETADQETPDLEAKQNHLEASPVGVGARAAWSVAGGTGENIKVVDIEVCWEIEHEDFATPFYVGANPTCSSNGHGTAVWGEVAAKRNGKGVTGVAHGAQFGVYGFAEGEWDDVNDQYIASINRAIQGAMDHLSAGDVLIIEQHMVGPDSRAYTAVEYWPHIYEQLKAATDRGILCVEAAGNGGSNFDGAVYNGAFDLSKRDSGCILVGAGHPVTRERLGFSNYGSRIDAFGHGQGVTTTAYGDAFNGGPKRLYTSRFNGTSSATPIVAGAVAVVSSIAKASGKLVSPKYLRQVLRETGAKQGPSTISQRIGNLPNIPEIVKKMGIQVRRR